MFKLSSLNFTLLDKYIQPSLTWKYIIATLVHRAKCSGFTITALKLWDDSLVVYRTFTLVKSVPFEGPKQNFSWGPHSFNMQKIKNIIFLFWPPGGPKQFAVRKQFAYASGRPWVWMIWRHLTEKLKIANNWIPLHSPSHRKAAKHIVWKSTDSRFPAYC